MPNSSGEVVAVVVALAAQLASAHGVVPQSVGVSPRPGLTSEALISTTFGGLLTTDDGATFRWLCEEAVGLVSGQKATWVDLPDGTLIAGAFAGLFVSRDRGCSWSPSQAQAASGVSALTVSGTRLYVASGRYGVENHVWVSDDAAATFTSTPVSSALEFYSSVAVARSRPQRVYVGAWYFDPPSAALLASDDNAVTFTRQVLTTQLPGTSGFAVLAVSPTNPELLLASATEDRAEPRSWLLRSADGGKTFAVALEVSSPITSAAFADDGVVAWVSIGDTLRRSTDQGLTWQAEASPTRDACVVTAEGRAWFCGKQELDGFALSRSNQLTTATPWLTWAKVAGVAECPASSATSTTCEAFWPALRQQLGLPAVEPPDAGPITPTPTSRGCGCDEVPLFGWGALTSLGWLRRRPSIARRA
jgi:hypothetical protein